MSTPDIITTGGLLVDNVVAADGTLRRSQIGGSALYSAAGACVAAQIEGADTTGLQMGLAIGAVGHVPANYPPAALAALTDAGLDLAGVHVSSTTVELEEWFFYRADGSRRDELFCAPADADRAGMTGDRVSLGRAAAFADRLQAQRATGVTFGSFRRDHPITPADVPANWWSARGLHLAANDPAMQIALAHAARDHGLRVTWDPGPRAGDAAHGSGPAHLAALMPLVDVAAPSEAEMAMMLPGLPLAEALAVLVRLGARAALVKRGAAGVMLLPAAGADAVILPALPASVVDPTGAGDAFCGGLLAGLVLDRSLPAAVERGLTSASRAVATRGPLDLITARSMPGRHAHETSLETSVAPKAAC